jgi:hypothetical protein
MILLGTGWGEGLAAFEVVSHNLQWTLWTILAVVALWMAYQAWRDA